MTSFDQMTPQEKYALHDVTTTAARFPRPLYKRLRHEAVERECSVTELVVAACEAWVATEGRSA